ncbi:hypothetical protein DPMN_157756 [Dreissena polymorpha]|uniref:Reverse transcriptase n=1 Tax=Dreissena polymorpha TaxID=45954 RepID=A0A9D4IP54_DREPO|nr:hypothetical protein DPMN_157756 [Dreissena polymorpha]
MPFPVRQGVRQGAVLSTWLYLLFIDKLMRDVESSGHGTTTGHLHTGNPSLADDVTLIS